MKRGSGDVPEQEDEAAGRAEPRNAAANGRGLLPLHDGRNLERAQPRLLKAEVLVEAVVKAILLLPAGSKGGAQNGFQILRPVPAFKPVEEPLHAGVISDHDVEAFVA